MRKILIFVFSLVLLLSALTLVGCAHKHKWSDWTTTKEATCTAEGSMERVCKCGEKETKPVAATGHIEVIDPAVDPTCVTRGFTEGKHCSVCNETLVKQKRVKATGHSYGEWIFDSEATCTVEGSKHKVCSVCQETTKSETIEALGHTEGEWIVDSEATCTEDGSKHQICSVCKESVKTKAIEATGHNYSEEITKATENSKASVKLTCKTCGDVRTETVEPLSVYAELTGSGITMTGGGMYYTRSFTVTVSGGYGEYQYKFESGSNLLQDFSALNECEVYGNVFVDAAEITITVKDEAGQQTVYVIKGNGTYVDSYVVYD